MNLIIRWNLSIFRIIIIKTLFIIDNDWYCSIPNVFFKVNAYCGWTPRVDSVRIWSLMDAFAKGIRISINIKAKRGEINRIIHVADITRDVPRR